MPQNLRSIPNTALKVRWKELYASEALNKKVAVIMPPGVYRGLRLDVSAADLSVDMVEDPDKGDHVAVFESSDGFSTTYRDTTSGRVTLDLSGYSSGETVVITVYVDYQLGVATVGEIRGFTTTEFDALTAAEQEELVVLGQVLRSASGVIPKANITHDGRSVPFLSRASESVPWNPMIRNGGFELGDSGQTYAYASPFWVATVSSGNFTLGPVDLDSNSGDKSLQLEAVGGTGTITATASQTLYAPVVPGRQIRMRLYKRGIQAATSSPVGRVRFSFEDKDRANDTDVDINFDVDTIDGAFVKFEGVIFVPDNMTTVKSVEVTVSGNYGSLGPCIRIDDVQAWCEVDAEDWFAIGSALSAEVQTDALFVGDQVTTTDAARVGFNGSNMLVERRDQDQAKVRPGLEWTAPTSEDSADAGLIIAPAGVAAGIEYTLMQEHVAPADKGFRMYVTPTGAVVRTVNAAYNNTSGNWTKDVSSDRASREDFSDGFTENYFKQGGTATWVDGDWQRGGTYDRFGVLSSTYWQSWTFPWLMTGAQLAADGGWDRAGNVVSALPPGGAETNGVGHMFTGAGGSLKTQDVISLDQTGQIMIMEITVEPSHTIAVPDFEYRVGFGRGADMRTATDYLWLHRPALVDASDTYLIEAFEPGGGILESIDTGVVVPSTIPHSYRLRIEVIGSDFDEGYKSNFYIDGVLIGSLTNVAALPVQGVGAGFASEASGSESVNWGPMTLTWNTKKV